MPDTNEIKDLVEAQGKAWEEFKAANDARLEAIESKGYAPAELTETVQTINDDLSKIAKDLDEVVKKANRPAPVDGKAGLTEEQIEHKAALCEYLRKGGNEDSLPGLEAKALVRGSDPDGGYVVDEEMDSAIDRIAGTISGIRGLSNVRSIGGATYSKLVKTRGISGGWLDENDTSAEDAGGTNMQFSRVEIKAEKGYAEPWITNEMLEDAEYDLEADLTEEAGITFGEVEGIAFVTGNGVGRPRGIASHTAVANASYTWGSVGYIASGAAGAFATSAPADQLIDLQHALKAQYRAGAAFVMADATLATVRQFKDSSGAYYMWQPDTTLGFGGRLLGTPVTIDDNVAAVAANSISILYANFKRAYTIVDRRGVAVIRDNITKKGVTKFHFSKRTGAGITNFEAVKYLKMAAS